MNTGDIFFCMSLSISLPVMAGLYRFRTIDMKKDSVLPLFVCAIIGLMMETTSYIIHNGKIANILCGIYLLFEFLLIYYQLNRWDGSANKKYCKQVVILGILIWAASGWIMKFLQERSIYFIICYSLILVLTSVNIINQLIFTNKDILRNYKFIICISIVLFYTYNILVEAICMNYTTFSLSFVTNVFYIKGVLNVVSNILFSIAILCVPAKQKFLLSF